MGSGRNSLTGAGIDFRDVVRDETDGVLRAGMKNLTIPSETAHAPVKRSRSESPDSIDSAEFRRKVREAKTTVHQIEQMKLS